MLYHTVFSFDLAVDPTENLPLVHKTTRWGAADKVHALARSAAVEKVELQTRLGGYWWTGLQLGAEGRCIM